MKKTLYLILSGLVLMAGLTACEKKTAEEPLDTVELRFRANDKYELDAVSPQAFFIVVKSTKPWTVRSYHPDWCIISDEEGAAQPDSLVHVGKGENTNVKVQYYDNTGLDDRIDQIEIASYGFVGKTVTVYQKGIAYLRVPEDEQAFMMEKAGGEVVFNVLSNQPWSSKIIEINGSWLSIAEGETGEKNGIVKLSAVENTGEMRYASVAVYDRNGEERAIIRITQDGVLLDPEALEIRAGYDQLLSSIHVTSNAKWTVRKDNPADDWFEILTTEGEGDGTVEISLQDNSAGTRLRTSTITISSVAASEDDAKIEKAITIKQAYPINPVRVILNNEQLAFWKSDWDNAPAYTQDVGTLFEAKCRLNRSMPFGTYTFRWNTIQGGARIRHWFCFSDGVELKVDVRIVPAKISFDFNASSTGQKPSLNAFYDVDFTQPIEITYKFDPSGAEHCHVTYLCNGVEMGSFDTTPEVLNTATWGAEINMYVGVQVEEGSASGSAVLEWYEYTAPMDWGD